MANVKDGATSTVATAPSPATSGTSLVVQSGEGARFPSPPFYAIVHPANSLPVTANAEKVLVTNVSTDTFTIVRAQGIYTAKSIATGWRISNAIFQEDINNSSIIQNEVPGGSINGSNKDFTLASATGMVTGSLKLFKNGIRLKITDDYTETSTGFSMVTAPATGTKLLADYNVNGALNNIGTNSIIIGEVPSGSINGSNAVFTLARSYIAGSVDVKVNGISQARTTHFTETSPSLGTITLSDAPTTGDIVTIDYMYNLNPSGNADTVDGYHGTDLMPIGAGMDYWGSTVPSANWMFAAGQAISRTDYAGLFAIIGTTYGSGNGTTTFNLPDKRGRVSAAADNLGGSAASRLGSGATGGVTGSAVAGAAGGEQSHTQTIAEMPSHNHLLRAGTGGNGEVTASFGGSPGAGTASYYQQWTGLTDVTSPRINISYTGSGAAFNIVQPTIVCNYIIKVL